MMELDNFSCEKKNGNDQCRMCIYTPKKLLLNLDFLNSPNQDNEVSISDYYKDSQVSNIPCMENSIGAVFDFEENVLQLQSLDDNSESKLITDYKADKKSLIKTAKPFIPKSRILRTPSINDENDSKTQNLNKECSLNSKCTSMNKFT